VIPPRRSNFHHQIQQQAGTMPPKRTVEDGETSGTPSTSSTAADMATLIRTELLTGLDSARKKRRVRSSGTTNVNTIDPTPCTSLLFKLPREIRDQIYQLLWIETPRIRQRYKRRSYPITYGALTLAEQHHISTEKVGPIRSTLYCILPPS